MAAKEQGLTAVIITMPGLFLHARAEECKVGSKIELNAKQLTAFAGKYKLPSDGKSEPDLKAVKELQSVVEKQSTELKQNAETIADLTEKLQKATDEKDSVAKELATAADTNDALTAKVAELEAKVAQLEAMIGDGKGPGGKGK